MTNKAKVEYKEIRIDGYVLEASLLIPKSRRYGDEPLYSVNIQPTDPTLMAEIELREEKTRQMMEMPYKQDYLEGIQDDHYSKILDGNCIRMESKFPPRFCGGLLDCGHDDEFIYMRVNAVGNWQVLPDGNSFISCHIIEPIETDHGLNAGI